jgi:hypothetical protein
MLKESNNQDELSKQLFSSNNVPWEVLEIIFRYLGAYSSAIRTVSKEWHHVTLKVIHEYSPLCIAALSMYLFLIALFVPMADSLGGRLDDVIYLTEKCNAPLPYLYFVFIQSQLRNHDILGIIRCVSKNRS